VVEAATMIEATAMIKATAKSAGNPVTLHGAKTAIRCRTRKAAAEVSAANSSSTETTAGKATSATEPATAEPATAETTAAVSTTAEATAATAVAAAASTTAASTSARERHVRREHTNGRHRAQRDHRFTQHVILLVIIQHHKRIRFRSDPVPESGDDREQMPQCRAHFYATGARAPWCTMEAGCRPENKMRFRKRIDVRTGTRTPTHAQADRL
jgi:hypothetical protein